MYGILKQLKEVGVHIIISDGQILLELLEDNLNLVDEVDDLLNQLLTKIENSTIKKVLLECPRIILEHLNFTKDKMKIKGERVIYN